MLVVPKAVLCTVLCGVLRSGVDSSMGSCPRGKSDMSSSLTHCRMQRRRVGYCCLWGLRYPLGRRVVYGDASSDESL